MATFESFTSCCSEECNGCKVSFLQAVAASQAPATEEAPTDSPRKNAETQKISLISH